MRRRHHNEDVRRLHHRGVVLLITLVILVILSTLGYTLGTRVAARRHRDRYVIDYAQAQYACASGMKYALVSLKDLSPEVISRPNEPDFSDVFALTEPQYQQLLTQMVENVERAQSQRRAESNSRTRRSSNTLDGGSAGGLPLARPSASAGVPGPYGPRWPLVVEPIELEIGSVAVTIEVEDENAKYPLGWALMTDQATALPAPGARVTVEDRNRAAEADVGFRTFCEWMGYRPEEVTSLKGDLTKVSAIRPFKMEFKPVAAPAAAPTSADSLRSRVSQTRTTAAATTAATRATTGRSVISAADQMDRQSADLARLFHSSLIDTDLLTRPTVVSESRKESALKYLGLWATRQVNVNTAPRHVLEAALAFGSVADAPKIADAIIQRRQVQPFSDVEELKRNMMRYSDAIEKSREFLTTNSTVFTVKVTAVSGVARKVALAGVTKEGPKVKTIAVISD